MTDQRDDMTLIEASRRACEQPSFIDALTWIAVWETERVVKQARRQSTWETCFRVCFEQVSSDWATKGASPHKETGVTT